MSSIYYVTRGASTLAGWTPQGARHVLGSAISAVSYLGWPSKRRATQLNMAQVTGRPVDDPYVRHLALASWHNYGRYAADFLNFPHLDMNDDHFLDARGRTALLEHSVDGAANIGLFIMRHNADAAPGPSVAWLYLPAPRQRSNLMQGLRCHKPFLVIDRGEGAQK